MSPRLKPLALSRNGHTVAGALIATANGLVFVALFLLNITGWLVNPYIGLLVYILLPIGFLIGLLLMPFGIWRARRRLERTGTVPREWPKLDLNDPAQLRTAVFVTALTGVNVVIVSMATYGGVRYMDTVGFCGRVCHTVMQPQFVAHERGPHARLECVACHVEPGATSFLQAKLAGAHQLVDVLLDRYARPIPSEPRTLRPTGATCKTCHWPPFFHGDVVKTLRSYSDDQGNTPSTTTLVMRVGGGGDAPGVTGIHWHVANDVEFVASDASLQTILAVEVIRADRVDRFALPDVSSSALAAGVRRRVDCVDCHNRPSHQFDPTAETAIDRAMARGTLPVQLPWIKKVASEAIAADYPSREAAAQGIAERVRSFYRGREPLPGVTAAEIDRAVAGAQAAYAANVFPAMRVTWGTYPTNIGHTAAPGCFRCHDGSHRTPDGRVIRQDCDLCHDIR